MSSELRNTGERVIPEEYRDSPASHLVYLTHVATYRFCAPYVEGRRVLDFGCGTGHGTAEMATLCASAVGVDVSPQAIEYARSRYPSPKVRYRVIPRIEVEPLPFEDNSFDAVVSIQVIEHVSDADAYLAEAKRVLRQDGVLVVATPDRSTRLLPKQRPWNRFHVREFSEDALAALLARHFRGVEVLRMSGTPDVIRGELERTRRLKWLTLPFTFPLAPEWYRSAGLGLLSAVDRALSGRRRSGKPASWPSERDVSIGRDLSPSINLVAVSRV
jgi:2-polyprenyl-3-methyl-5-hydroxy-6-metoxy-1,4-benzoquinol methylase